MPTLEERYPKEITDLSLVELKKFLAWCKSRIRKTVPVIGGWAVYAYAPKTGSIDIDIVIDKRDEPPIKGFFKENGFKRKEDEPNVYFKEITTAAGRTETIHYDVFYSDHVFKIREASISFNLLDRYSQEISLEAQPMRVPTKELLLILKVAAYRDREDNARMGHFRRPPGERERLESKIEKDKADIRNLFETAPDQKRINDLLEKTGFKQAYTQSLKELGIIKTQSKTITGNASIAKAEEPKDPR